MVMFPDGKCYRGLMMKDIPEVVELLWGTAQPQFNPEPYPKNLFLVCAHNTRDPRCGKCGPTLQIAFQSELSKLGLKEKTDVWRSSHLSGHRFAGIVVCYPSGNWYGRVTPKDIPALVKAEMVDHKHFKPLWRGRIGLSVEEQNRLGC
jgi:hypothetical protein